MPIFAPFGTLKSVIGTAENRLAPQFHPDQTIMEEKGVAQTLQEEFRLRNREVLSEDFVTRSRHAMRNARKDRQSQSLFLPEPLLN
jgi:hypothetical protein